MTLAIRFILSTVAITMLFLHYSAQAVSQPTPESPIPAERTRAACELPQLERWADTYFAKALEERRFSGATAVLVQGGHVVFSHGYGWDDIDKNRPMNVARSQFHLGSIGKVLTATAIGQLLESRQIASIDDPANRFLKRFKLPDAPNRPITIRDLLTHRGGFEDWFYGIINEQPVRTPQDGQFIQRFMPRVVNNAGEYSVYSSFGVAMLGAIIEDVSGQSYRDYIARHVFAPMGMRNSEIPYSPIAPEEMARAYAFYPSGEPALKPRVVTFPFFAPAGVALATPNDFGRFMMAQLGNLEGKDILGPSLRARLHTELARNHASMTGLAMLFGRLEYNDQIIIYHAGNGPGFDSFMALFPEHNAGLFLATAGGPPTPGLLEGLLGSDRMKPSTDRPVKSWLGAQEAVVAALVECFGPARLTVQPIGDLSRYQGTYWGQRRSHSTWEAVLGLATNFPDTVTAVPGGIMINEKGPYLPIGNDTFQRRDDLAGVRRVAFSFRGQDRAQVLHRFPGLDVSYRTTGFHPGQTILPLLLGLPLLLSGLLCAIYPISPIGRSGFARMKWAPAAMVAVLVVGVLSVTAGHPPEEDFFFGIGRSFSNPWRFTILILAANAVSMGALFLVWGAVRAWLIQLWGEGWVGRLARSHFTLVAVGSLGLIPFFMVTNLLGWHWPG